MKLLNVALFVAVTAAACASRAGSSPSVPKPAIEKAADTKIQDAGTDSDSAPR
jgi:hypothetical protein